MPPTVAIIMRAKDEMPYAQRAVDAVGGQSLPWTEFHAVDSGSTDGTLEVLRKAGASLERIAPDEYIPGKVLNAAIERTHCEIIVLLNADAIPLAADWLRALTAPITTGAADLTFSKQQARPDAPFMVADDYARAYDPAKIRPDFFSAVACAFRRTVWEQHRFREAGYAEDAEWAKRCLRHGARIQFVPESVVEHSHTYSLKALSAKRYRQAITYDERPNALAQLAACMKEIIRDAGRAVAHAKAHTIPYNIAYRITIHRAIYRGLKAHGKIHD